MKNFWIRLITWGEQVYFSTHYENDWSGVALSKGNYMAAMDRPLWL